MKIDVAEYTAALKGEEELQKFCAPARDEMLKSDVVGLVEALSSLLPPVDKEALLQSDEFGQYMVDVTCEALKVSADGWVDDSLAFVKPWGFEMSEIKVPVILYQGTEDKMVPYAHGEWLAKHMPQEKLKSHLLPGQGHISIFVGQCDSIIDEFLELAKVTPAASN